MDSKVRIGKAHRGGSPRLVKAGASALLCTLLAAACDDATSGSGSAGGTGGANKGGSGGAHASSGGNSIAHGGAGAGGTPMGASGAGNGSSAGGSGGSLVGGAGGSAGSLSGGSGGGGAPPLGASGNAGAGLGGRAGGAAGHAGDSSAGMGGESGGDGVGGAATGGSDGGAGAGGADNECTLPVAMPPISGCGIYGTVTPQYRVGDATHGLSFDIRLRARELLDPSPVPLNHIEVQYYFSLEEDSPWQASVDSFVQRAPDRDFSATSQISLVKFARTLNTEVGYQTHFIRIRNNSASLLLQEDSAGEPYLEFHVTLTPSNTAAPNQNHANDYSFDASTTTFKSNSRIGVFVCGQLVAGCTPGAFGVGP